MRGYAFLDRSRISRDIASRNQNAKATTDFFGLLERLTALTTEEDGEQAKGYVHAVTLWGHYDGLVVIDTRNSDYDTEFEDDLSTFSRLLNRVCEEDFVADSNTMLATNPRELKDLKELYAILAIDTFPGYADAVALQLSDKAAVDEKTLILGVDSVLGDYDVVVLVKRPLDMQEYVDFIKLTVNDIPEITKTRTMFVVSPFLEIGERFNIPSFVDDDPSKPKQPR